MNYRCSLYRFVFTAIALSLATATVIAGSSTALDSPVQLDPGFGVSGQVNGTFSAPTQVESLAHFTSADGGSFALDKITDAFDGFNCPVNTDCLQLRKLFADGTRDSGFNVPPAINFARLTVFFGASISTVSGAAQDSQNRVIVVGATAISGGGTQIRVVRLLTNGLPDTSFSVDGIANIDFDAGAFPGGVELANAVAIDAQDRIVIAGSTQRSSTDSDFAVMRLLSDGTLDNSFSNDGKTTVFFDLGNSNKNDTANAIDIAPDGKITVAGSANDSTIGGRRIAIARFNSNGTPDTSFCPNASCNANTPYTIINSGRRVGYYFALSAAQSDDVRDIAINDATGALLVSGTSRNTGADFGFVQVFSQAGLLQTETGTNGGATDANLVLSIGSVMWTPPESIFSTVILFGASGPSAGPQGQRFFRQQPWNRHH